MGLETGTYISDLVTTNPVGASDPKSQGDDHIRLLKSTIKATFPNLTGAMTATHAELNLLAGAGSSGAGMLADIGALTDPNADRVLGWDDSAGAAIGFTLTAPLAFDGTAIKITDAAGIVTDLAALADPGADRILGWDESADAAIGFALSTGLTTSGTNLLIDTAVVPQLAAATNSFTGGTLELSNALPILRFKETGGGADAKNWLWYASSSQLILATATDASPGAAASSYLTFSRSGTTPGTLTIAASVAGNNAAADAVGYRGMPINAQSDNYTLVAGDAGKYLYQTGSTKTFTIPANASVAFPIGTVVTFVANPQVTIAITSDTLYLAGTGFATTGSRTLATGGVATALKITSTGWLIWGVGLT